MSRPEAGYPAPLPGRKKVGLLVSGACWRATGWWLGGAGSLLAVHGYEAATPQQERLSYALAPVCGTLGVACAVVARGHLKEARQGIDGGSPAAEHQARERHIERPISSDDEWTDIQKVIDPEEPTAP